MALFSDANPSLDEIERVARLQLAGGYTTQADAMLALDLILALIKHLRAESPTPGDTEA